MNGSKRGVGVDNVNGGDGENKVDPGNVHSGVGDSNDDIGIDSVSGVNTNGVDDANYGDSDSKFDSGNDRDGDDCDKILFSRFS